MDESFYAENFDREHFNKKTGEKLSVSLSFDGTQLEIKKRISVAHIKQCYDMYEKFD